MCACVYVCMYVCMYMYVCVCVYVGTMYVLCMCNCVCTMWVCMYMYVCVYVLMLFYLTIIITKTPFVRDCTIFVNETFSKPNITMLI